MNIFYLLIFISFLNILAKIQIRKNKIIQHYVALRVENRIEESHICHKFKSTYSKRKKQSQEETLMASGSLAKVILINHLYNGKLKVKNSLQKC